MLVSGFGLMFLVGGETGGWIGGNCVAWCGEGVGLVAGTGSFFT